MNTCPLELKRLYREGRVLPFVGAGVSMSVSWDVDGEPTRGPSWTEMVNQAARILGYDDPELLRMRGSDLQILEYFRVRKKNFSPLINWMVMRLSSAPEDAIKESTLHSALASLSESRIFYTTNYDDFLERSFVAAGRKPSVITSEEDMGMGDACQIVKFHGDFNNPDAMVMSEGHYYSRMRLDGPMDLKLRSDLFGRAVLFVGYSFRDINIAYLFRTVNEMFRKLPNSFSGRRAYIIVRNPSDFEIRLFHARNIEVIPVLGDDQTASAAEILNDMAS